MLARPERFLRHMESGDVHVTLINEYRVLNKMVKRIGRSGALLRMKGRVKKVFSIHVPRCAS